MILNLILNRSFQPTDETFFIDTHLYTNLVDECGWGPPSSTQKTLCMNKCVELA